MSEYDFQPIIDIIVEGEGDDAAELVQQALNEGVPAAEIIERGLVVGMGIVSDKYDQKEYFVPDLAASADAMMEALEILKPKLETTSEEEKGIIVIGVVKECSQEIGKNIVSAMLSGAGFKVYDLGTNVAPAEFVDKVKEVNANILAMSSPMLQTIRYMREAAELLQAENLRDKVKITVGGASTNSSTAEQVGADAWSKDGNECIQVCIRLMNELCA